MTHIVWGIQFVAFPICRNEVTAREGIDTEYGSHPLKSWTSSRNEVTAREGIDTAIVKYYSNISTQGRNEVTAREGIDTPFSSSERL